MDSQTDWASAAPEQAIRFTGSWREYLPIAATNALLIVVTLGVYRFWATARQRRYLWSRTHVIDDCLEWTGTGKEMFLGFLIVVAVLAPFFLFIQFLFPALVARGMGWAAGTLIAVFYVALVYLGGFARFRAVRYRLSRSWWHGIRGGSNDRGWAYAGEFLGRYLLAALTLFVLFPWAATRLWNSRWNAMSFGPHQFSAALTAAGLKRRWAAIYLLPMAVLIVGSLVGGIAAVGLSQSGPAATAGLGAIVVALLLLFYLAIPLLTLHWFAKFYRKAAGATKLGPLEFQFTATTRQWLGLFLGNIALAVVTLGFGLAYWGYRNWSFFVRHAQIHGTVELSELTQSQTLSPREAEGFADAIDVGAI